jgi:hypothetical protein
MRCNTTVTCSGVIKTAASPWDMRATPLPAAPLVYGPGRVRKLWHGTHVPRHRQTQYGAAVNMRRHGHRVNRGIAGAPRHHRVILASVRVRPNAIIATSHPANACSGRVKACCGGRWTRLVSGTRRSRGQRCLI